jgi:hypothetical protein
MNLPILCLDFDGVIHDYKNGWKDGVIYGELTPGFLDWAHQAGKLFDLVIYSSRSKTAAGVIAMSDWLRDKARAEGWQSTREPFMRLTESDDSEPILCLLHAKRADVLVFKFAHEKPPAFLTIDDRCQPFGGSWDDKHLDPQLLRQFKPWTQG